MSMNIIKSTKIGGQVLTPGDGWDKRDRDYRVIGNARSNLTPRSTSPSLKDQRQRFEERMRREAAEY